VTGPWSSPWPGCGWRARGAGKEEPFPAGVCGSSWASLGSANDPMGLSCAHTHSCRRLLLCPSPIKTAWPPPPGTLQRELLPCAGMVVVFNAQGEWLVLYSCSCKVYVRLCLFLRVGRQAVPWQEGARDGLWCFCLGCAWTELLLLRVSWCWDAPWFCVIAFELELALLFPGKVAGSPV